jgi:two-component sensor histidine kinase
MKHRFSFQGIGASPVSQGRGIRSTIADHKGFEQENFMTELALKREITLERILVHELIHRINNEFSSLIGAVSRTAARSVSHETKVALAHVIELLSHYAELHRALQMPEADTQIDAAAYLENLCLSISRSKLDGMKIDLVLSVSPLQLPSERCWQLGMMVYELVTNAARHAFGNGNGQVRVELSRAGRLVECRVVDNGSAPSRIRRGQGLRIVDELVKGLDGRLDQRFGQRGSFSILTFPYGGEPHQEAGRALRPQQGKPGFGDVRQDRSEDAGAQ